MIFKILSLVKRLREEMGGTKTLVVGVSGLDSATTLQLLNLANYRGRILPVHVYFSEDPPEWVAKAQVIYEAGGPYKFPLNIIDGDPLRTALQESVSHIPSYSNAWWRDNEFQNFKVQTRMQIMRSIAMRHNGIIACGPNYSDLLLGYHSPYELEVEILPLCTTFKNNVLRTADFINDFANKELIPHDVMNSPPSRGLVPYHTDEGAFALNWEEIDLALAFATSDKGDVLTRASLGKNKSIAAERLMTRLTKTDYEGREKNEEENNPF